MEFKNLLFTTDDWGISPGVNQGILELAQMGVVKRVSVLANGEYVAFKLDDLKKIKYLEIGIHFNCTLGKANGELREIVNSNEFLGLSGFLFSLFRKKRACLKEVTENLIWQLGLLRKYGIEPSYLDGHHHIHLLPGVFSAIIPVLKETKIKTIRTILDLRNLSLKKLILFMFSLRQKRKILFEGFETLPSYYPIILDITEHNFSKISRPTEIIVHPASEMDFESLKISDCYRFGRVSEFNRLKELRS